MSKNSFKYFKNQGLVEYSDESPKILNSFASLKSTDGTSYQYNKKLVVSGNIAELYIYQVPVIKNKPYKRRPVVDDNLQLKKSDWFDYITLKKIDVEKRIENMRAAKKRVRNIVNANAFEWYDENKKVITPKFLTLTFSENIQDIKKANYEFKKFRQRLEYDIKYKLQYTAVIEFQKRGAIHYHVAFYNMKYKKVNEIAEIWGHGFVKIDKFRDLKDSSNVGAYMSKYMSKNFTEEFIRLAGEKSYFNSKGLKKPKVYYDKDNIKSELLWFKRKMIYKCKYESKINGNVIYMQFNMDIKHKDKINKTNKKE